MAHSTPTRRLGRLASVVPASPTKTSSESISNCQSDTVLCTCGILTVRTPISAPRARTRGVLSSAITPRASLCESHARRSHIAVPVCVRGHVYRNPRDGRAEVGAVIQVEPASEGAVTARQLENRPVMRAGEVLETVPGLIISQHSGKGKANQYYLRTSPLWM